MLVLVKSRAQDEVSQVKLQVRQTDQVWFHRQMQVSSLAGDLPRVTHTHTLKEIAYGLDCGLPHASLSKNLREPGGK